MEDDLLLLLLRQIIYRTELEFHQQIPLNKDQEYDPLKFNVVFKRYLSIFCIFWIEESSMQSVGKKWYRSYFILKYINSNVIMILHLE
jgi:hypothetical protein